MQKVAFLLFIIIVLTSCQSDPPSGNEILFGDVIGNYDGECADYTLSTEELMNREDATLSIIAASTSSAGIKTSCDRISDQELPLKTASAAKIIFEKSVDNIIVTMTYIAEHDSIVIIHTQDGKNENLIFTGKRN